ncbi:MAG: small subunit ribosomal protein [Thermoleophilaceae bacterium]|jgi:small subunit ribosomal protein S9|nr:small subunit ribosomal protein [Thermoleophilaceae bacterium]
MTEEPREVDGETPEDEAPEAEPNQGAPGEGAPGEPGEATPEPGEDTPSETAPDAEAEAPAEADADADAPAEADADAPAEADAEAPADPEAPGPEIEGLDELEQAAPAAERPERGDKGAGDKKEEVIPGLHLEPDLVLEEQRSEGEFGEYDQYADDADGGPEGAGAGEEGAEPAPVAHTPLELAADARYHATGKRKSAIARVILKPGEGTYTVNGRHLDEYFPRVRLQRMANQPLEATGYQTRMDVVARIHGGGVSAQASALRHGIARALVEADPALRAELKRRGYLTRDPREKERKKAGLKKARKRPQFSKR